MKRAAAFLMSLLLAVCLIVPQAALAATQYSVLASISGPAEGGITRTVSAQSGKYNTLSTKLGPEIATAIGPQSYYDALAEAFPYAGMGKMFNDCVAALAGGSGAWADFLGEYSFSSTNMALVSNYDATIQDLKNVGGVVSVYYVNSKGNVYTLTVTLIEIESGTPVPGGDDTYPGVIVDAGGNTIGFDGGYVVVSDPYAAVGGTVILTAVPSSGYILEYINVTDANGTKLPLAYNGNGQFSFTMPASTVTVTAKFCKQPADPNVTGVADVLNTDDHIAFMVGDADGKFRPNDNIKRSEVAMMFYRLLRDTSVETSATFSDVKQDAWYAEAVGTLASLGILKGVEEDVFNPDRAITRAEFAAICARFAKAVTSEITFSDVAGHWAEKEMETAAGYGWISGYTDGTFAPDKPITRMEAAAIVNRMLYRLGDQISIDGGKASKFPDVNDTLWGWFYIGEATTTHEHEFENGFVHEFWK